MFTRLSPIFFLYMSVCLFVLFGSADFVYAAPKSELKDRHWLAHDNNQLDTVNHTLFDDFLATYVSRDEDGIHKVRYGRVSLQDKRLLKNYLAMLQGVTVTKLNRLEQMAFWINFYNALTLDVVLDAYPVASIRDISGGFFRFGPWDKKLVSVEGRELSLNNIEHNILRPIWQDPRIHYVVNCASISCPNLALRAYTSDRLEEMLQSAAKGYINSERGARLEDENKLIVSRIYAWYKEDFGNTSQGLIDHLKIYATEPLRSQLERDLSHGKDSYNWSLNDLR